MIRWKLKTYLEAHGLTPYKLAQRSGLARNTVYGMTRGESEGNLRTLETVVRTLREVTGEEVKLEDVVEIVDAPLEEAQERDEESRAWQSADLAPPLEPYDWGDVEPSVLGKPIRYVPGEGIVVVGGKDE